MKMPAAYSSVPAMITCILPEAVGDGARERLGRAVASCIVARPSKHLRCPQPLAVDIGVRKNPSVGACGRS